MSANLGIKEATRAYIVEVALRAARRGQVVTLTLGDVMRHVADANAFEFQIVGGCSEANVAGTIRNELQRLADERRGFEADQLIALTYRRLYGAMPQVMFKALGGEGEPGRGVYLVGPQLVGDPRRMWHRYTGAETTDKDFIEGLLDGDRVYVEDVISAFELCGSAYQDSKKKARAWLARQRDILIQMGDGAYRYIPTLSARDSDFIVDQARTAMRGQVNGWCDRIRVIGYGHLIDRMLAEIFEEQIVKGSDP